MGKFVPWTDVADHSSKIFCFIVGTRRRAFSRSICWPVMGRTCEPLADRKQELRRLLTRLSADAPLKYTEHIDGRGTALFQRVCELDLEGIVAKQKFGPYVTEREHSTWFKILNREYSQKDGREELFERERHSEPVPGWQVCVLACAELEQGHR
jgi:hypothetical protein